MERPSASDRRWLVVILVVTAAAYLPTLGNGYVWDDVPLIVQNALFDAPFNPRTAFFTDLWAGAAIGDEAASGYFRPLMVASLWVDHGLGGHAAVAHLHSLVWHLVAVALAFRLGARVGGPSVALAGAVALALHPAQSEAVMWVAARNDLMAAVFGLLGVVLVTGDRPRPMWAVLAAVCAGLSKESVFLMPVAAAMVLRWGAQPLDWRSVGRRLVPLVVGLGLVVGLRMGLGVGGARGPSAEGAALVSRSVPALVGWLGWKLAVPWPLSSGYVLEYLDRLSRAGLVAGGLGVLGGAVLVAVRGGRVGRLALGWGVLFLAPTAWALATTGWMGERYLYLSMLGVGWGLGALVDIRSGPARVVVGVLGLSWAVQLGLRTADWKTDATLWQSAWMATPSPFTAESLGHALRGAEGPEAAVPWFVRALDDDKPLSTACGPLMRSAVGSGKMVRAVQLGHWAHARGCRDPEFHGWRALTLASTGRWGKLEVLLDDAGSDPGGRLDIARAALALVAHDDDAYAEVEARWTGARPLRPQAEALVANATRHAPVVPAEDPMR